jgi:uncharacterized protein
MKITITIGETVFTASLLDNQTGKAIYGALPLEGKYSVWGDEYYFSVPIQAPLENAQEFVEVGDLAFWPPGNAFCLFFGPTPASIDDRPRAASEVTVFGKLEGDAKKLKNMQSDIFKIEVLAE